MSASPDTALPADPPTAGVVDLVYGIHLSAALAALLGGASVAGALLFALPLLIALGIGHLVRGQVQGAPLQSHLRAQVRSAWLALTLLVVLSLVSWAIATVYVAGFAVWLAGKLLLAGWLGYRSLRGWIALGRGRTAGRVAAAAAQREAARAG